MDRSGIWRLAPAYDVIYSYNPGGAWTSRHQMSLAGKRDDFSRDDLLAAARAADLKPPAAKAILCEVSEAVSEWRSFAERAGVDSATVQAIVRMHRTDALR